MLIKLMKHEFRATARVMLPLYLVTILLALMTRASALWTKMVTFEGLTGQSFLALLSGIIAVGFSLALIATFVVAVVLTIQRFRSNLMADEGYVMFTLPVSTHSLVWSKLIVSTVWFLGAVIIDIVAVMTLVADLAMFQELGRVFAEISQQLTAYNLGNGILFLVELAVLFVVVCLAACLDFYAPWPLATALPSIRCCCRWPSSSPSRWRPRSFPALCSWRGSPSWTPCPSGCPARSSPWRRPTA